jgi:replicative DNA helicase
MMSSGGGGASSNPKQNHSPGLHKPKLADYFTECAARISQTDYPQHKRGLSPDVIERFNLGYDPNFSWGTGGKTWQALIIPTGESSYIARNTYPDATGNDRHRKQGASPIYNSKALYEAETPIFVTEGELDALSMITLGGEAVALGSVANAAAFVRMVGNKKPVQPLILALDNDESGNAAAAKISAELEQLKITFHKPTNLYGAAKDANEAMMADKDALLAAMNEAISAAAAAVQEARDAELAVFMETCDAAHINAFIGGIKDSVNTHAIPTGFPTLDNVLDGGLYEGLYVLGAISSLGKTTFALQIANQIAKAGQDVIIFSLEMSRYELIAKSISRITYEYSVQSGSIKNAKTVLGITTGKRYDGYEKPDGSVIPGYSDDEVRAINEAIHAYAEYAQNIHTHEGTGDIGVQQIREIVRQYIDTLGRKPVVVVDYLQMLAPYNERATDKQNMDKAIMELKRISRDFKISIIGISSFNRENYNTAVSMMAFKESGSIEYSCDVLIGLQLKGVGDKDKDFNVDEAKQKYPREVELVILKNRKGITGSKVQFEYYAPYNFFKDVEAGDTK